MARLHLRLEVEMSTVVVTQPAIEPVSVADAKAHCRVVTTDDDSYIEALIAAARQYVEDNTRRKLITQTLDWRRDYGFPRGYIELPYPPLQSVTSVTYVDGDGTTQTLSTSKYSVDTNSHTPRIYPVYSESWPTCRTEPNAVTVRYVAGYGDAASDVPQGLRHAIKLLVAHWYEAREPIVTGTIVAQIPMSVQSLIGQFYTGDL